MALLPPGVSENRFRRALKNFRAIVGDDWVFASDDDRATYLDPYAPGNPADHAAAAAVAPKTLEEIQAILKVANREGIPLWPVSTGRNLAYGTAAPAMKGSVVLDLKRMNRILEINEDLGYALVEPGVSFFDFYKALDERGMKVWMSGPAHSWGSVIGNALEHGIGYTPYADHAAEICGMEVVLADGEVVRTGMGAIAGGREWQIFKHGYGPGWDSLFTQSNFGVVTKMGVWLMPAPEEMAYATIQCAGERDLEKIVDTLRPLRLDDTINGTYMIHNPYRQVVSGQRRDLVYRGDGAMPRDILAADLKKRGKGWWAVDFALYDQPEVIDIRLKKILGAFDAVETSGVDIKRWRRGEPFLPWMRQLPTLAPLGSVDWMGGPGGHTNFAPVVAPVGERVRTLYDLAEKRFLEHGIDYFVGLFGLGRRALILNAVMFFNKDDPDMTARVRALYKILAKDAGEAGFGDYRAHISFMDDIASMYAFNDHALMRLNERVKDALDPNGVLAPGKQGIWPKGRRPSR